jgi:hypothetical protein
MQRCILQHKNTRKEQATDTITLLLTICHTSILQDGICNVLQGASQSVAMHSKLSPAPLITTAAHCQLRSCVHCALLLHARQVQHSTPQ